MTDDELAKHWNVSLEEVKNISEFMNSNYTLCVGRSRKDGLFYGLMFRNDEKHGPMLSLSSKQGYATAKEAAKFMNDACDIMIMPEMKANFMDVPQDAYKALKKIDVNSFKQKTANFNMNILKERELG